MSTLARKIRPPPRPYTSDRETADRQRELPQTRHTPPTSGPKFPSLFGIQTNRAAPEEIPARGSSRRDRRTRTPQTLPKPLVIGGLVGRSARANRGRQSA